MITAWSWGTSRQCVSGVLVHDRMFGETAPAISLDPGLYVPRPSGGLLRVSRVEHESMVVTEGEP